MILSWNKYIIEDIDKDGENELIVLLATMPDGDNRVFDVQGNTVYCYSYCYRAILHVYTGGIMLGSGGIENNCYYTANYNGEQKKDVVFAETRSNENGMDFFIGDKKVTEEEYDKYFNKNFSFEEIPWSKNKLSKKIPKIKSKPKWRAIPISFTGMDKSSNKYKREIRKYFELCVNEKEDEYILTFYDGDKKKFDKSMVKPYFEKVNDHIVKTIFFIKCPGSIPTIYYDVSKGLKSEVYDLET